ncbi:MAG TPA: biotin/lipoyl-containing protein, partial [Caulobacteraceae bacterium]|nr:biotin/lipoyl-containing protein [Caulobacteraceae bacterium]
MTDVLTPTLGESVTEATVARWAKKAGDTVKRDELLVELETDKVGLEVAAPEDGVLSEITAEEGATVAPGETLGKVSPAAAAVGTATPATNPPPQTNAAPAKPSPP